MPKDTLTVKQRAFAQAYILSGNATQAYKDAGYAVSSDAVARVEGNKLLKHPRISLQLARVQQRNGDATGVTVNWLTIEYRDTYMDARSRNDASTARQCLDSLARLHGHVVSRQHVDVTHSNMSIDPADVDEVIAQLTAKRDGQPQLSVQASATALPETALPETASDTERAGA